MLTHRDLLIEIGTEELPPKALLRLSEAFTQGVCDGLQKLEIAHGEVRSYATPRRLALLVSAVAQGQPDHEVERRGPALAAAFDGDGNPSKALLGFCRSCGATPEQLQRVATPKGEWLVFRKRELGRNLEELLPSLLQQAVERLPIPKRMRWGSGEEQFVRPVHWLVVMYGNQVLPCTLLGQESSNLTYGHRFHHPQPIQLDQASDYEALLLEPGRVIADFALRRAKIRTLANAAAEKVGAVAVIDEELLDEVTALNEWPVPVVGGFESRFLEVPAEVLIEAMQDHQKYFPMVAANGTLAPRFITIANIESRDPEKVVAGNERVIRPRFSDAAFFWEQDRKHPLESRLESLQGVVFQARLGTLYDKTQRVVALAERWAGECGGDVVKARRAALLCKCDLLTQMVYEFTDLQGVMGRYYALHDGEDREVAMALDEVYKPRFAGDTLPTTPSGRMVALADRIDTLIGIFAAGQRPTGEKDPFGLRRAALGVLRILIETPLGLDLREMLTFAYAQLPAGLGTPEAAEETLHYIMERLRAYYHEQGITPDVIESVMACDATRPMDFDRRIHGVTRFFELPEAASLAAANKRIANILRKAEQPIPQQVVPEQLQEPAEQALFSRLQQIEEAALPLLTQGEYAAALAQMATLREPVDHFFDAVMVMAEEPAIRANRLALLQRFAALFLRVADLSRLQHG